MKKSLTGLSCGITLDSRADKNGLSKVIFRIRENRVKRDLYTRVRWPREFFDAKTQTLLPRTFDDVDVVANNLRLNQYKAVAHRLQLNGYLKNDSVTIDDLVNEFKDVGNSEDFFVFMEAEAKYLYNHNIIAYQTFNRHKSSLHTLQLYYRGSSLPVNKINLDLIQRFDAWGKRVHKRGHNTVCGYHKDIKKYLGIALRKCMITKNPYDDFSFAYVDGDRIALSKDEVSRLYKLFEKEQLPDNEREILKRFLFSCVTGLRVSDTSIVHRNMIRGTQLVFVPYKGRIKGKKITVPLSSIALELIDGRTGLLFEKYSHGYINEILKILAGRADIFKRLTTHCARDTFGTIFMEMGGDIRSLSDIMGHSSHKTTMIYLKMSDTRKQGLMNNFDEIFKLKKAGSNNGTVA